MKYVMTTAALNRIGKIWVREMKKNIRRSKKIASGNLLNSIGYEVIQQSDGPILQITYADYFPYVNDGRKPKGKIKQSEGGPGKITAEMGAPPVRKILQWINIKGIRPRRRGGRQMTPLSLAFAVRANIYKYGIKPADLYDKTLENVQDMLNPDRIPQNIPQDLRYELNEIWEAMFDDVNVIVENILEDLIPTP